MSTYTYSQLVALMQNNRYVPIKEKSTTVNTTDFKTLKNDFANV